MAAGTYNIDDPQNINSFLAMLGGSQISVSSEPNRSAVSEPFQVVDYSKAPNLGIVEPVSRCPTAMLSSRSMLNKGRKKRLSGQSADLSTSQLRQFRK